MCFNFANQKYSSIVMLISDLVKITFFYKRKYISVFHFLTVWIPHFENLKFPNIFVGCKCVMNFAFEIFFYVRCKVQSVPLATIEKFTEKLDVVTTSRSLLWRKATVGQISQIRYLIDWGILELWTDNHFFQTKFLKIVYQWPNSY